MTGMRRVILPSSKLDLLYLAVTALIFLQYCSSTRTGIEPRLGLDLGRPGHEMYVAQGFTPEIDSSGTYHGL